MSWALSAYSSEPLIVGRIEQICLPDYSLALDAKLDTGADMSSLSATDIKIVSISDKKYVQFKLRSSKGKVDVKITRPFVGYTRILLRREEKNCAVDAKKYSRRPVITLPVCIKKRRFLIQVNLADRTNFSYPMLIGIDALEQMHLIVDASQHHTIKADCP